MGRKQVRGGGEKVGKERVSWGERGYVSELGERWGVSVEIERGG